MADGSVYFLYAVFFVGSPSSRVLLCRLMPHSCWNGFVYFDGNTGIDITAVARQCSDGSESGSVWPGQRVALPHQAGQYG